MSQANASQRKKNLQKTPYVCIYGTRIFGGCVKICLHSVGSRGGRSMTCVRQRGKKLLAGWPEAVMLLAPKAKASKRLRWSFSPALGGHWQKEVWLVRHETLVHLCLFIVALLGSGYVHGQKRMDPCVLSLHSLCAYFGSYPGNIWVETKCSRVTGNSGAEWKPYVVCAIFWRKCFARLVRKREVTRGHGHRQLWRNSWERSETEIKPVLAGSKGTNKWLDRIFVPSGKDVL